MEENLKDAYRYLLYWAMLDIRQLRRKNTADTQYAMAALADWLHNLAYFSCRDFKGFDEETFWRSGNYLYTHYPDIFAQYKELFYKRLNEVGWLGADKENR